MRVLLPLTLLAELCACADEPTKDATPTEPAWLAERPENAHAYAEDTLARFRKLVEGRSWRERVDSSRLTLRCGRKTHRLHLFYGGS
jgi:hypothetical protein